MRRISPSMGAALPAALDRRVDIDVLRVFATYMLFIFHVAKVFDPAPFFHVRNAETSPVFYIVAGFIAQWHMPLFFLLAGWSALTSIRSRGARGFFNERARKILIPLVAGCVFFGPVLKYYELRSGLDLSHTGLRVSDEIRRSLASVTDYAFAPLPPFHESFAAFWPTYFTRLDRFTWSHLWFLAYLFAMSITLTPLLLFLRGLRRRNDDVHSSLLYAPLVPLLIVQLTLRGRFPGIYNLYNDWANIAFYGVYFLSGALLAGPAGAERAVAREWKRALSIGTAAMLVLLLTALQLIRHPMVPLVTSTIAGWCFVLGLVGLARALNPANSSRLSWLSESAFPVYVLHQPVIVVVGFYLVHTQLGIPAKFLLLLSSSVVVTIGIYELLRRIGPARLLLGMKPLVCPIRTRKVVVPVVVLIASLLAADARAEPRMTATLYEIGSQRRVVLFRWELDREESQWTSRYRTPAGDLAAEDRVSWDRGRFSRYEYVRPPVGERAQVERKNGKVFYTQVVDGRTRNATENDAPNYAVGPTLIPYVQSRWPEILARQRLSVRYGVPDQLRSFEFEVEQDPARSKDGAVVVRVRPASGFLRLFVDPVYIAFSANGRELRSLTGRVLPMDRRKGRLHPYDAELVVGSGVTGIRKEATR